MPEYKNWFETWFNTSYYDVLYSHRNDDEAAGFIDKLVALIQPPAHATMLDAGCGKGRHAKYLAEKGFYVTGIDLCTNCIKAAKEFESDNLHFFVHDMRNILRVNYYDVIFNFFTSFGYFNTEKDNLRTINTFANGLKKGGYLVIDFFNADVVIKYLIDDESKQFNGIHFQIEKHLEDNFIIKKIQVKDGKKQLIFYERVMAIRLFAFLEYFKRAGLTLKNVFGNYHLQPFEEHTSQRLILIAQK
jgi:SAM-dependent methyltransferase